MPKISGVDFSTPTTRLLPPLCRDENFNPKTSVICMDHFKSEDFGNKLQYDLGFAKRRLLVRVAVPSVKQGSKESGNVFTERERRVEKRENTKTVQMLIKEYEAASVLAEVRSKVANVKADNFEEIEPLTF